MNDSESLTLRYRWASADLLQVIAHSIWTAGIIILLIVQNPFKDFPIEVSLLLLVIPFGGLFIIYYSLSALLNNTIIYVDKNIITIKYKPLPWLFRKISVKRVRNIYSEKKVRYSDQEKYNIYILCATLDNNRKIRLLKLDTPEEAVFIELQIKSWLRDMGLIN